MQVRHKHSDRTNLAACAATLLISGQVDSQWTNDPAVHRVPRCRAKCEYERLQVRQAVVGVGVAVVAVAAKSKSS